MRSRIPPTAFAFSLTALLTLTAPLLNSSAAYAMPSDSSSTPNTPRRIVHDNPLLKGPDLAMYPFQVSHDAGYDFAKDVRWLLELYCRGLDEDTVSDPTSGRDFVLSPGAPGGRALIRTSMGNLYLEPVSPNNLVFTQITCQSRVVNVPNVTPVPAGDDLTPMIDASTPPPTAKRRRFKFPRYRDSLFAATGPTDRPIGAAAREICVLLGYRDYFTYRLDRSDLHFAPKESFELISVIDGKPVFYYYRGENQPFFSEVTCTL